MQSSKKGLLRFGVATPATCGTVLMRVVLAIIIILATTAIVLYTVALGIDQVYMLHNQQNIYLTSSGASSSSSSPATAVLLLPQFDVTVGLVTTCVSHSCTGREGRSGLQDLMASTLAAQTFTAGAATALQTKLEGEFVFGYDAAESCGTNTSKVRSIARFGYASYALSLFFFIGVFVTAILFCLIVGEVDVLAGTPTLDKDSNAINVEELGLPGIYVMLKLKKHLLQEGPLITSLIVLSLCALGFGVCAMGTTIAIEATTSRCGVSACRSFMDNMDAFLAKLVSLGMVAPSPRTYSCRTGAAFSLVIVGFVMGVLCLLLSCLLLGWFACSRRRQQMIHLRDHLYRLAEVQGLLGTVTGGGATPFPLTRSRQVSGMVSSPSAALLGGDGNEREAGGAGVYRRGVSTVSGATTGSRAAVFSAFETEERRARSVGARIGLYRAMKQFTHQEEQARQAVALQEKTEFYSLLAMRECLWYNEELRVLHDFTLSWFVGPPLDLCVLETNARQLIIHECNALHRNLLTDVAAGFETSGEPADAGERSSSLQSVDSVRWAAQVSRWQTTQAAMAPLLLHTASYRQADPPPPRKSKSAALPSLAPPSTLDTDRWLTLLDKLRHAYDEGAFLLRSASPMLAHRNTSVIANFEDDTSFSSNVFSDPSFAQARCDDFIPPDNVRLHLMKAAKRHRVCLTPPPRLRVLPRQQQGDDASGRAEHRRTASGASGASRRQRAGAAKMSSHPSGRAPGSRTPSPAAADHGSDTSGSPAAQGGGDSFGAAQAPERPFSSRNGTSSGRTPFQTALATHNATAGTPLSAPERSGGKSSRQGRAFPRSASPADKTLSKPTGPQKGSTWLLS